MTKPEVVVFDLGKVLLDFDYQIAARKLVNGHATACAEDVVKFLLHTPLLLKYETGLLNREGFYTDFCSGTGYRGSLADFADTFGDIFTPIEPMIQLHADIQAKGVPTYIFSNTNDMAVEYIRRAYPFFSRFTGHVLSYEHRLMKPDPRIYEVVERMSGRRGSAILYIDDRLENTTAGIQRGWRVILHADPASTLDQVRQLGLLS